VFFAVHWTNCCPRLDMGRKSCQYNYILVLKYSFTGMTFCPYRLDQLLDQWPVDDNQNFSPIFIPLIISVYWMWWTKSLNIEHMVNRTSDDQIRCGEQNHQILNVTNRIIRNLMWWTELADSEHDEQNHHILNVMDRISEH